MREWRGDEREACDVPTSIVCLGWVEDTQTFLSPLNSIAYSTCFPFPRSLIRTDSVSTPQRVVYFLVRLSALLHVIGPEATVWRSYCHMGDSDVAYT